MRAQVTAELSDARRRSPTIFDLLTARAAQEAAAPALCGGRRAAMSYGALAEQTERLSRQLRAMGIARNDRVAIVMPNGPEMAAIFLAATAAAAAAPLNPAYRPPEFDFYFSDLDAKILLTVDGMESAAASTARARGLRIVNLTMDPTGPAGALALDRQPAVEAAAMDRPRPGDTALLLHTSGTTSRPKMVPLTQANLCTSAHNIAAWLGLGPADRCLNVMPLFHIHGLAAALLASLAAGGSVACSEGFVVTRFFDWLREHRPTWYTAVPTMHQAVVARAQLQEGAGEATTLRFVRSSSAPLPPQVAQALEKLFGVPVIEAYGMTEAAHQMCSNPLPPRARRFGSVGLAAGPDVAIMDERGTLLESPRTGEVVIRGDNVTAGYANNPQANDGAFTNGWFRTGDLGRFDTDGYLFLIGRIKEIINRGGEKISPREVDEALLDHPAVAAAVAFPMPDARLGEEVAAAVVLRPGAAASEAELMRFAAQRLADFKIPRRIVILDEIPKGPTGKPQRIGLAAKLKLDGTPATPAAPDAGGRAPSTEAELALAGIWSEVLNLPVARADAEFLAMGGDSVLAAQVIARVRRQLHKELSIVAFFTEPTLAAMARAIEAAPAAPGATTTAPASALSRSGDGVVRFAATIAQRRMWFIQKLVGDAPAYQNTYGIRFRGALDAARLKDGLERIISRHDALRMHFEVPQGAIDSELVAVVSPRVRLDMPELDLRGVAEGQRAAEVRRRTVELGSLPFDLGAGPLLRTALIRIRDDEHLLVYVVHHIVSDRWSMGVMMRDLAALYAGTTLGPPGLAYADHAVWQNAQDNGPAMAAHLDYYRALLADPPQPLDLPADHARPAFPSYRGDVHTIMIEAPLADAMGRIGRRSGATAFMTFLAAFAVLMHRVAGRDEEVIGLPLSGRDRVETEGVMGVFINMLPVRLRITGEQTFAAFLAQVKQAAVAMLAHGDLTFDRMVEGLRFERDPSRHPIFGVVFNFHNVPYAPVWPAGLTADLEEFSLGTSRFDLMVTMRPAPGGAYCCEFEYNRDLFEPATMERVAEHFRVLLEGIAARPDVSVDDLPLLDDGQRRQLLLEWSGASAPPAAPIACAHEMFEAQAARTPGAEALVFAGQRISYEQLNARANRLAWRLRGLGVGPEKLVAICLDRTAELPVAILAVLKAGGAYVPLDPEYPQSRLAYMLQDSAACVLITQERLLSLFASDPGRAVVSVDQDAAAIAAQRSDNPPSLARLDNLAYVIYTSGSTGRPKGVAIEHRGPASLLDWARNALADDEVAGMLFSTSVCFDLSVFELLVPLSRGGKIILVQNALELPACAAAQEVTFINTVPSAMAELVRLKAIPASVRAIGLGGEAMPAVLGRQCALLPGVRHVYNLYGPTEDTVYSTVAIVRGDDTGAVPIGRPLGGSRAFVLDARMQPVPVGVVGELYLGGSKLARGYLGRPELTAERFVANPFAGPPERLYRTGDLCRWNAEGAIVFLGRADHQVKVRGYRIELAEIEAVLAAHPGVRQCAVIVTGDANDRGLAGYVVGAGDAPPGIQELRRHLAAQLPAYMIPNVWTFLEAMPLTPNGKTDRRALPVPHAQRPADGGAMVEPRGPVQEQLARIWRDVLGLERVGADDNFFDLGGHSLRLLAVASRVEASLGVHIPLHGYFERPTIAGFAGLIEERLPERAAGATPRAGDDDHFVPLQRGGGRIPLFCIPAAGGHAFTFEPLARLLSPEQPVYALQFQGVGMSDDAMQSVQSMAADFLAHLRRVRPDGPYRLAGYCFGGVVAYEMARQLVEQGQCVDLLALIDGYAPGTAKKRPLGQRLVIHRRNLAPLGAAGGMAYVWARVRRRVSAISSTSTWPGASQPPPAEDSQLHRAIRRVQEAGSRANKAYRPGPFGGAMVLFRAAIRPDWNDFLVDRPCNGWKALVGAGVQVHHVPGTHMTILREPGLSLVARELERCLTAAASG